MNDSWETLYSFFTEKTMYFQEKTYHHYIDVSGRRFGGTAIFTSTMDPELGILTFYPPWDYRFTESWTIEITPENEELIDSLQRGDKVIMRQTVVKEQRVERRERWEGSPIITKL